MTIQDTIDRVQAFSQTLADAVRQWPGLFPDGSYMINIEAGYIMLCPTSHDALLAALRVSGRTVFQTTTNSTAYNWEITLAGLRVIYLDMVPREVAQEIIP